MFALPIQNMPLFRTEETTRLLAVDLRIALLPLLSRRFFAA